VAGKPMQVLVIGGTPAHPGGVEAFCARSAEALAERGTVRLVHREADTAFLGIRRVPALVRRLLRLFGDRRGGFAGVWVQYVNLPDLLYVGAARLAGFRVMVTPHLGANWRSQERAGLRRLSRALLGRAQRLALISRTQELEVALPPGLPRALIRNFLPQALWAEPVPPANDGPALQLIHSGRLSAGKGTFVFVEACAALRARGVPFQARITGGADADTMAQLHALVAEHGLGDQVAVLGRVSDAELLRLLRAADVLVHPSRIDSYPLIVLEALACGVFPVCMELAGARDMIESYAGHVVGTADPAAEIAAFLAGADAAALRAETLAAAARVREDYHWNNCAAALERALGDTFA
jgi:glycosyltransferase involved in cell wall biosynthesis